MHLFVLFPYTYYKYDILKAGEINIDCCGRVWGRASWAADGDVATCVGAMLYNRCPACIWCRIHALVGKKALFRCAFCFFYSVHTCTIDEVKEEEELDDGGGV